MFRLSKLTDYAIVVLVRLARASGVQTSASLAAATGIPEPTVAKVLKALAAKRLVASQRGARGGYKLGGRGLDAIGIVEVIAAIDGPVAITACVGGGACETAARCPMHGAWDPVNAAVIAALDRITLADMSGRSLHA